jgi:hypothetical protein
MEVEDPFYIAEGFTEKVGAALPAYIAHGRRILDGWLATPNTGK